MEKEAIIEPPVSVRAYLVQTVQEFMSLVAQVSILSAFFIPSFDITTKPVISTVGMELIRTKLGFFISTKSKGTNTAVLTWVCCNSFLKEPW